MRDHTRIHAAGIIVVLFAALCAGCSRGEQYVPLEIRLVEQQPADALTPMTMTVWGGQETYYVHDSVLLDERDVAAATVTRQDDGVPAIELVLTREGREALMNITRYNLGERMGIIVDGQLQCVTRIESPNTTGVVLVTGHMLEGAARRCSEALTRNAIRRESQQRDPGGPDARGPERDEPPA